MSPWVGHHAQIWGRLPFLRLAFAALVFRALLFAAVTDPYLLVAVQILDGITAAALGVMVPLMIADITRGTGRFNLAQGIVGTAVGIGASISPTLAGYLTDHFGSSVAFLGLARWRLVAFTAVWALMPETRAVDRIAGRQLKASAGRVAVRRTCSASVDDACSRGVAAIRQASIDRKIVERHAPRSEPLLEPFAYACARQMRQTIDRADRAGLVLDDEARHAVVDDLRHRAAIESDDRRSAGHRLDHHQAERLRPVDRHQQGDRAAQERRFVVVVDLADVFDIGRVDHRMDLLLVVIAVRPDRPSRRS